MIEYHPIKRPTILGALNELKIVLDIVKSGAMHFFISLPPARPPRKIILLPGFGMTDNSLKLLQHRLNLCGHKAMMWGIGRNHGKVTPLLNAFGERLRKVFEIEKEPLDLIGWSLGGYIAREAARDNPDAVRQVITLAGPAIGGPKYTLCGIFYEQSGWDLDKIESTVKKRFDNPIMVPIVSIYTRWDGIVSWESCFDKWSPDVRHIEVHASHMGMPFSMEVLWRIIENL
ncbi:MAG: PGAP1 family protein [Candidatus Magnetoglobus multicellularis str. Araruama]|uniref:PGAP1 family protein n=1 Tax=Candidatus Magnetoglobus multicellularis str. Araruama TaxID=890399 RepID=A0A1V1PG56_9BACT|nr:MAG: PGAP1 family protein [Candidatus Magnetoglobus multicellularis str. Araruama]